MCWYDMLPQDPKYVKVKTKTWNDASFSMFFTSWLTSEQSKSYEKYVHLVPSAGLTSWTAAVGFTVNQDTKIGTKAWVTM